MTRTHATRPGSVAAPVPRPAGPVPARGSEPSGRPARRRLHGASGGVLLLVLTGLTTTTTASTVVADVATVMVGAPIRSATGPADYRLPVPDAPVRRAFEAPPEPWAAGHRGVDLTVAVDTVVAAPAGGVVTFAGPVAGRGVVTLRHDDGLLSSLEPLAASVRVGDRVGGGQPLGTLTAGDHCAPASCLHWGVRTAPDAYVDPLVLVTPDGPVVLLPP